jgi:hypothetical protein
MIKSIDSPSIAVVRQISAKSLLLGKEANFDVQAGKTHENIQDNKTLNGVIAGF